MRADRQTAAAMGEGSRDSAMIEAEALEVAEQIDGHRQQAEDLRLEIETAVVALSTVVTNLSAVVTGAVMQLHSIKQRVGLLEPPEMAELEPEPVLELPATTASHLTSQASGDGDPLGNPRPRSVAERLDNYTLTGSGCHEWNGQRNLDGFGLLTVMLPVGNRQRSVHRLAWKAAHGEIPHGMQVRHRCGNRACINVEHLELVQDGRRGRRPAARVNGEHVGC
jgi:hypothetical protein